MKELLRFGWDVLLLRDEAYAEHVARADVLKRGLTLLVLVTLLAGSVSLMVGIVGDLRPVNLDAERREVEGGIRQFLGTWQQFSDLPADFEEQMMAGIRAGMDIGFRIAELPTPLPKPVGRVLRDLGTFLSRPFGRMAWWMGYGIWVLLVARLLGGKATVSQMLGATALFAVPHVLRILGFVPCLGSVLGLVATVWGIAIYVKALAVANDFTIGRAVTATVVPALVAAGLAVLGGLALLILALATG